MSQFPSFLDPGQIIQEVYDTAENRIRVDTGGGSVSSQNLTEVGGAPIALGQTTSSASLPVTIANNQTPIPTVQLFTKPYDSITATYPSGTQEVYQTHVGGTGGAVQQTLTVNYTDSTKAFLLNAAVV